MGVVFQSYSLFPHMTVAQNVAFPLSVRKVAADQARTRVAAALAKVQPAGPMRNAGRSSSPAASSSAWRWRVRWCSSRGWC